MTRQEITKEAQEQVNCCTPLYPECFIQGYIAGAEPREKRIEELEQQVEKMKSALIDIKTNTDDVNIEWQIKYLFDELEIKENG